MKEYIDLGLPSGTLWATENEIRENESVSYYTFEEAKELFKDNLPSKEQFQELIDNCKWEWLDNGYKITGKNGNFIIIPALGYYNNSDYYVSKAGFYWASTKNNFGTIASLYFNIDELDIFECNSDFGHTVRLVKNTESTIEIDNKNGENVEKKNLTKLTPIIDLSEYSKNEYIINLGDYELKEENGVLKAVRKVKYPETYLKCCDVLNINDLISQGVKGYKCELLESFQKLIICRDAYWKIAGDKLGLNDSWKPNWRDSNFKYCIKLFGDKIVTSSELSINCILAFPTEEMCNTFYDNFKNLIEVCKEFL